MAGTGICVLCLADTCTSEVHPVFNPVAPYGYLLSVCICLWQISQIQTFLFGVVGPGLVSTSPTFVSNSANHPAGPHGRHAQKNGKSGPHCWGRGGSAQFAQQFEFAVTAPPLVGCVVWSHAPHCHPCICGPTPPWRLHCWTDGRRSWLGTRPSKVKSSSYLYGTNPPNKLAGGSDPLPTSKGHGSG